MRRLVAFVLLLGIAATASAAPRPEDPAPETLSIEQVADAVIAAAKAKDATAFKALAESETPDPWRIADILCAKGEFDIATTFAKATIRASVKGLPAYVASRKGKSPETAARAALTGASEAIAAGEFADALSKLDGIAAGQGGVLGVDLASARAAALGALKRHEESALAYASAGDLCAKVGWAAGAGSGYFEAGRQTYATSDRAGAIAQFLKALPFLEVGTDRAMLAGTLFSIANLQSSLGDWKKAIESHERALATWDERDKVDISLSCLFLGGIHFELGDLDKALEFHNRGWKLREEIGSPGEIGDSLSAIAAIHEARGDATKALDFYGRALLLQRAGGNDVGESQTLSNIGVLHAKLGDMKKALAFQDDAIKALGSSQSLQPELACRIQMIIGWIHYRSGDQGRALGVLTEAQAVAEKLGGPQLLATILGTLGSVYVRLGDYPKAMGLLVRARNAMEQLGERATLAEILGQIADIHKLRGEFLKAMEALESAQHLAEEAGNRAGVAKDLSNTAGVYVALGEVRKALEMYERANAVFEKVGHRSELASGLACVGATRARLEDYDGAVEQQAKALAIQEQLGDQIGISFSLANSADTYIRAGKPALALPLLERGQILFEKLKDRAGLAATLDGFGDAYVALKDPKKALDFYDRAARQADRLGMQELLVDVLTGAAEAHLDLGEGALALEKAKRGADYVARLTQGQGEEQGAAARSVYARLYDAGTRAAALLGNVPEAAFFLETGRAGTLLESLGGREMMRSWSLSSELLAAETKARADESAALHAYGDALDEGELEKIRARKHDLGAARTGVQEVIERITRESKSAIIVYPKAATLEDMQGFLEASDALVLYWLLPGEAIALVMTPDDARLVTLGKTSDIEAACEALTPSDATTDPKAGRAALEALVAAKLKLPEKTKRVLISSDGALSYVPFSLLFPDKLVAYVPSGTVYGQLRDERAAVGKGVLALGDPDYRAADSKAVALLRRGTTLAALPGSGIEAMAVGDEGQVLLGPKATVSALIKAVAARPRWHSIHLGCHGLVDPENPMRCSLALTPEAGGSGLLMAQDVGLLKIPTDLAVLSACETMKGRIYRGEGIVGISRMFMYAGAPRLLASLWKVDDEATRALMIEFYRLWNPKDGTKPLGTAEALAGAQAHVREQKKWEHPYYWAAWVLWGLPD